MPKNNTASNTYQSGRDQTAGRNADAALTNLDRAYENHPDRKGVNAGKHDFHHGERSKSAPLSHDGETGHDNKPINQRDDQPCGTPTALEPFNPRAER